MSDKPTFDTLLARIDANIRRRLGLPDDIRNEPSRDSGRSVVPDPEFIADCEQAQAPQAHLTKRRPFKPVPRRERVPDGGR